MDIVRTLNAKSAQVWNLCVQLDKEYRGKTDKFLGRNEFQKQLKGCIEGLSAKNIQFVMRKYLYARDNMFKSIKAKHENSHKVKLPYKHKKFYNTGWDSQSIKVDYEKGKIRLGRPHKWDEENQKMRKSKPFIFKAKDIPKNIAEIELIYRGKYYLVVKYKEEVEYLQIQSKNEASIDLGEIHAITTIDNNGNAMIATGRLVRSFKRFRNKELAKLTSRRDKCVKYSNNWWKYTKAIDKLKYKSERKINDCIHKLSSHFLEYCLMNNISVVYYGDLDSAIRNTKQRDKVIPMVRQKLTQWNFGQLVKELENKLSRHGIKMIKVKEYYTSQKCPNCSSLNKPTGRNYVCSSCNYTQHRDIVGATNILNDNGGFKVKRYNNLKYLQIR